MAKNRKAAEELCLSIIAKIVPDGSQVPLYKQYFDSMNDKEFEAFISRLESGQEKLCIISHNFSKSPPTTENNLAIAKELGHNFFTPLIYEGINGMPSYSTPIEYMVIDVPSRRASQTIVKKAKIPKNQDTIDFLTGQPTGDSKGAKISYPELQLCMAMELDASMTELMSVRGGDDGKRRVYNAALNRYGSVSQKQLEAYATGVTSTSTLKTLFTCIHLKNNL